MVTHGHSQSSCCRVQRIEKPGYESGHYEQHGVGLHHCDTSFLSDKLEQGNFLRRASLGRSFAAADAILRRVFVYQRDLYDDRLRRDRA